MALLVFDQHGRIRGNDYERRDELELESKGVPLGFQNMQDRQMEMNQKDQCKEKEQGHQTEMGQKEAKGHQKVMVGMEVEKSGLEYA